MEFFGFNNKINLADYYDISFKNLKDNPLYRLKWMSDMEYGSGGNVDLFLSGGIANDIIRVKAFNQNLVSNNKDLDYFIFYNGKPAVIFSSILPIPEYEDLDGNFKNIIFDNLGIVHFEQINNINYYLINSSINECYIDLNRHCGYYTNNYDRSVKENIVYPPVWWQHGRVSEILQNRIENPIRLITRPIDKGFEFSDDFVCFLNEVIDNMYGKGYENILCCLAKNNVNLINDIISRDCRFNKNWINLILNNANREMSQEEIRIDRENNAFSNAIRYSRKIRELF
jgi:hypothetical protein